MRWRIELLGGLRTMCDDRVITRFRTQKAGALLAYLAYHPQRSHPRDDLIDLLWPECDLDAGRHRLRNALSSLRRPLEPPGVPAGAVIVADRTAVRLNPAIFATDVAQFETALQAASRAGDDIEEAQRLIHAAELYHGELLPGYFEAWILPERQRLAEAYLQALGRLIACREEAGDLPGALQWAHRAVAADPLREEARHELMRLLAIAGQPAAALRQFRDMERVLAQELGAVPAVDTRALARQIEEEMRSGRPASQRRRADRIVSLLRGLPTPEPLLQAEDPAKEPRTPLPLEDAGDDTTQGPFPHGQPPAPPRLPLQFTRFFGREAEIARLQELLLDEGTRLVTLTGSGGTGKTRLALAAAARLQEAFAGAVWFVPLADLSDPRLIADKVRDALRLPRSPDVEPLEQVLAALSRQPALLLLDNFEHLLSGGAPLVQALRQRVRDLTCLVTSRQVLGLEGEREFPLLPLPTPRAHDTPVGAEDLLALSQCASVQLFVDRAQAVLPDFQVTERNAAAVAALCTRLEGIPLALELAAARARVLTPAQIVTRLEQRFELLVSRQRHALPRHHSLRAALDWSYELQSPELRRFFAQLSVFRGGWTLAAAEVVCDEPRALEYLEQLRECSMILAAEGGEEMRYRLLETLREYGMEQLTVEERTVLARRHATYYRALVEEAEPRLRSRDRGLWLARLEQEHDNFRTALAWSLTGGGDGEAGLRLAGALHFFWRVRGYAVEGREWLRRVLAHHRGEAADRAASRAARAKALAGLGYLAWMLSDSAEARTALEESISLWRELGDAGGVAYALMYLGMAALAQGDAETARTHLVESVVTFRAAGDPWLLAVSLINRGTVEHVRGDHEAARTLNREGMELFRTLGDPWGVAGSFSQLGEIASDLGDYEGARLLYEQSLQLLQEVEDKWLVARALNSLGEAARRQGDTMAARRFSAESLAMWRELGDQRSIAAALQNLGLLARSQGDFAEARSLLEESVAAARKVQDRWAAAWPLLELGNVSLLLGDDERAARLYTECLALCQASGK